MDGEAAIIILETGQLGIGLAIILVFGNRKVRVPRWRKKRGGGGLTFRSDSTTVTACDHEEVSENVHVYPELGTWETTAVRPKLTLPFPGSRMYCELGLVRLHGYSCYSELEEKGRIKF